MDTSPSRPIIAAGEVSAADSVISYPLKEEPFSNILESHRESLVASFAHRLTNRQPCSGYISEITQVIVTFILRTSRTCANPSLRGYMLSGGVAFVLSCLESGDVHPREDGVFPEVDTYSPAFISEQSSRSFPVCFSLWRLIVRRLNPCLNK
ncbi:hypothetical protein Hypma_005445, partial [Hypsizygus marmoreus]